MTGLEFITYFQLFLLKEVYGSLVYEQIHIANYINNFVKILTLRESYIKYYLKFLIYENFIVYNKNVAFLNN